MENDYETWIKDLTWSRVNALIAKKTAKQQDADSIHTACTLVIIPLGDPCRKLPYGQVLRQMGHKDIAEKIEMELAK